MFSKGKYQKNKWSNTVTSIHILIWKFLLKQEATYNYFLERFHRVCLKAKLKGLKIKKELKKKEKSINNRKTKKSKILCSNHKTGREMQIIQFGNANAEK